MMSTFSNMSLLVESAAFFFPSIQHNRIVALGNILRMSWHLSLVAMIAVFNSTFFITIFGLNRVHTQMLSPASTTSMAVLAISGLWLRTLATCLACSASSVLAKASWAGIVLLLTLLLVPHTLDVISPSGALLPMYAIPEYPGTPPSPIS